jgi:hypothetical protein
MAPTCELLATVVWLDHDVGRGEFEKRLTRIGVADGGWVTIARCNDCSQVWRVDRSDRLQVGLAIKVASANPAEWSEEDDRSARLAYLVESYGGESAQACEWAACPNHALCGVAFCGDHLFESGVRARQA